MRFNKTDISSVKTFLSQPRKIIIITHQRPDGDAIGSSLGMFHYLKDQGHIPTVVVPDDFAGFLNWMPGTERIVVFAKDEARASQLLNECEMVISLDFNDMSRAGNIGKLADESDKQKVMIDHHLDPQAKAHHAFCYPDASSTCELVCDFIIAMDTAIAITPAIAQCLYTGIVTDTGSFKFNSTSAHTHEVLAILLGTGINNQLIHENLFDNNTVARLRLLGFCLNQRMTVYDEYGVAVIAVSSDDLKRFDYHEGDSEGVVNYPLSITGVNVSAFFREDNGFVKISFRSKGDFSVKELSQKNFEGGGHRNAAGGKSDLSLEETVKKFVNLLPQYKTELKA